MAESLGMTHEDARSEHDQSASRLGSRSRHLRNALGAPITVLVAVGPREIFSAEKRSAPPHQRAPRRGLATGDGGVDVIDCKCDTADT
jgi:hypothetical protein